MLYRLACPADAEALVRLNAAFNEVDDVSPEDVRRSLAEAPEVVVVAVEGTEAIAFCCAQVHHSFCYKTPVAEVTELYVDPACRRRGLGAGMLRFLTAHLQQVYGVDSLHLLTGCSNGAAQALYKSCGFREHPEMYLQRDL